MTYQLAAFNFETDVSGWVAENGAALTRDTVSPISGTGSAKLTGATAGGGDCYTTVAVVAGQTVTYSVQVTTAGTITGTPHIGLQMPGAVFVSKPIPLTQATPATLTVTATAVTSGNAFLSVFAGAALGDVLHFDNVDVELATAPTLTPYLDANPSPRCLVTFGPLAPATATITVTRVTAGRQMQVRGGIGLACVGGAAVMDYEVPFGVPAVYQAQMFDGSGNSLGFTDTATTTMQVTAAWVHQPLSPTLAISPQIMLESMPQLVRETPGELLAIEGATVNTWIGGQRLGLSQVPITFLCASTADADEFQSMFGGYSTSFPAVLCIRTPPPFRLPPVFFASCPKPQELDFAAASTIEFSLVCDEVRPPTPGLVIPILRREDLDAAYPTRGARSAAYATRLARDNDYTKAGLAGP